MRRRWYYFKRMLQADRLFVAQMIGNIIRMIQYAGRWIVLAVVCVAALYLGRGLCAGAWKDFYENYAVRIADDVVRGFLPAWKEDEGTAFYLESRKNGSRRTKEYEEIFGIENENGVLRAEWIADREQNQGVYGDDRRKNAWGSGNADENAQDRAKTESSEEWGNSGKSGTGENGSSQNEKTTLAGLLAAGTFNTGNSGIILEKLNDYDYLMKKFYNVHPTTTAGRDLMRAENFLAADLSIEKNADIPQILIYHTHSQETYADYPENSEADVIHLGECLAKLLREKGYNVYHDESVYEYRDLWSPAEIPVYRGGLGCPPGRRLGWDETCDGDRRDGDREDHVLQRDIHEPGRSHRVSSEPKSQGKPGVQLPDAASGCRKISGTYAKNLFKRPPL